MNHTLLHTGRTSSLGACLKSCLVLLFLLPGWLPAQVDLSLFPASPTVNVGDDLTITLRVVAGSQELDGIEAYLDFDPAFVTVNSVVYEATVELPTVILDASDFDPAGYIDAASGILGGGSVSGAFDYLTVDLTVTAAGATTIDFSFDTGPPSRKTEIARVGLSVLGSTTGTTITILDPTVDTEPVVTVGGPADKVVAEGSSLRVPLSVADLDGDNLTVTVTSVSNEPQLLESGNSGSQVDPFPTSAASFLTISDAVGSPGAYSANLDFTPVFGDGGGANGDGNGVYTVTIAVSDGVNSLTTPLTVTVTDVPQPLSTTAPTRIQAESFDNQGIVGAGGGSIGVGVEINGPNANIGFTQVGDFVDYLIDVPQSGTYDFFFQVAKGNGGTAAMDIKVKDEVEKLASIMVTNTLGWQTYVTATATVALPAGLQTLRFEWSAGGGFLFNVDYVDIEFTGAAAPVVSISAPIDGATVTRGTGIQLTGTATDNESTNLSAGLQWSSSDPQFSTTPVSGTGGSISGQWITPGSQTLMATVTDSGNRSGSDAVTVTVSSPGVTITRPTGSSTLTTTDVQVQWTATEVLYGLAEHFHLYVNPPDITNLDPDTRISTAGFSGQTYWDLTALEGIAEGVNTVVVRVANQFHEEFLADPTDATSFVQDVTTFTVTLGGPVELPDPCENTLYRINVGGPLVASADATPLAWGPDAGAFGTSGNSPYLAANSGGGSTFSGGAGAIVMTDPSVPASATADLFTTERYDLGSAPEMRWEFPVTPGTEVQVTLLFAEIFGGIDQAGQRVFDVAIEGAVPPAFSGIDPFAIAGANGAFTRSTTLTVTDGLLVIEFIHGTQNPALKGIQICNLSGTVDDTPPVITLLGDNPLQLPVGAPYTDPGATAFDNLDGDLTAALVVGGDVVNTSLADTYTVTYNVLDAAGNAAAEVSRTVTVNPPGLACAYVAIDPNGSSLLTGSTFGGGLIIANNSQGELKITSVSFDLSTAVYPNMVFDPVGSAGDATAKCLTVTEESGGDGSVGLTVPGDGGSGNDPDCTTPFLGQTEVGNGGYSVLTVAFDDFEAGEAINFAIDIDPTSTKGFNGAGNAGAVSGLELTGTTVTVTFSDGQSLSVAGGELYRKQPGSQDAAENYLYPGSESAAPGLTVSGVVGTTDVPGFVDATVDAEAQTARISGTPGDAVSLLVLTSTIEDVGPGVTPAPYEANKVTSVLELDAVVGPAGTVDLPLTLAESAAGEVYQLVAVKTRTDDGRCGVGTSDLSQVWRLRVEPVSGEPDVLVQITPGAGLGASTFGSSSFGITNRSTGSLRVTGVSFDLSTGILPDMVFDPTGAGGDATAQCFTAGGSAAAVGLVVPTDPCTGPFSAARNGGFDVLSTAFTDFDPGETFTFAVDIDPNSIQGVAGAGNAGSVSGYELIGATVTVSFDDGSTLLSSTYQDGSLGGSQAFTTSLAPAAPTLTVVGLNTTPASVGSLTQTIKVTGTPGDHVSLLQMDSRLYIASGSPPFGVSDVTYYANEAMAGKTLYTGIIGSGGTVDIPVTLLTTSSGNATPDGGLNQFIAVTSVEPYAVNKAVSTTSNVLTLRYDAGLATTDLTIAVTRQGMTDHSGDYTVRLYPVGSGTPAYDRIATADATGALLIADIAPGVYELAVKYPNCLQVVDIVAVGGSGQTHFAGPLRTGDVNDNNYVNVLDFSSLVASFNVAEGGVGYNAGANLDGVGKVNVLDHSLLVTNFNVSGEIPSGLIP